MRCTETSDTLCPIWNNGRVRPECYKYTCRYLAEEGYDISRCKCGGTPKIWGEGMAKQYVIGKDTLGDIFWTDFDGYRVGCQECGSETHLCDSPESAISTWNVFT